MTEFFIPRIEIRSKLSDGVKKYVIKGYAATPGNIYHYDQKDSRVFKEYFTDNGIANIKRKAKATSVFADYGHQTGFGQDLKKALGDIETKSGLNLSQEKDYLNQALRIGDLPMFRVENIDIDNKGLFIEIEGNPSYRNVDTDHEKYFDAIWSSLENGFINGMSLNMKPTQGGVIEVNEGLRQIDDVDIFGISLVSGAANDMANITEVAMRCCMNTRGEIPCQTRRMML